MLDYPDPDQRCRDWGWTIRNRFPVDRGSSLPQDLCSFRGNCDAVVVWYDPRGVLERRTSRRTVALKHSRWAHSRPVLVSFGARLASDETGVESICPEDKSSFPLVPFASFALRLVAVDPVDKPRTFFRFHW